MKPCARITAASVFFAGMITTIPGWSPARAAFIVEQHPAANIGLVSDLYVEAPATSKSEVDNSTLSWPLDAGQPPAPETSMFTTHPVALAYSLTGNTATFVPEPSTGALLLGALGICMAVIKRPQKPRRCV